MTKADSAVILRERSIRKRKIFDHHVVHLMGFDLAILEGAGGHVGVSLLENGTGESGMLDDGPLGIGQREVWALGSSRWRYGDGAFPPVPDCA